MTRKTWDKETWLDVSVNLVPIAVMVVFIALFLVFAPWGIDGTPASLTQFGLILAMILILGYLTYAVGERL